MQPVGQPFVQPVCQPTEYSIYRIQPVVQPVVHPTGKPAGLIVIGASNCKAILKSVYAMQLLEQLLKLQLDE